MADVYSPALKEIAGRLQSLSYKDMVSLGGLLTLKLESQDDYAAKSCTEALLAAAETIAAGAHSKGPEAGKPGIHFPPGVR